MQTEPTVDAISETAVSEESTDILTAGDILRQERQRLGLNEKEVADQLHITMHYVKALESNRYEKLPGAVFARGYLKSYALLLGLDVEDLLARYDEFADRQKADSAEANRLINARKKKDRNKPFVIVSLVVFVAGFLLLWLANSFFTDESVSDIPRSAEAVDGSENLRPALSQVAEQRDIAQPQLSLDVASEEPAETILPSAVAVTASDEALALAEPEQIVEAASTSPADSAAGETAEAGQSPTLEDLSAALLALRAEQAGAAEPSVASDGPRVITVDAMGSDVLTIRFIGESWVEVNDSESQQIYRDIREAGDVLEITGSAPFNILLGDAPFTRMSLNGDEIDLSADIRIDNSARLTVGL